MSVVKISVVFSILLVIVFGFRIVNMADLDDSNDNHDDILEIKRELHESFDNLMKNINSQFGPAAEQIRKYYEYENQPSVVTTTLDNVIDAVKCKDGFTRVCFGYKICPCIPKSSGSFGDWVETNTGLGRWTNRVWSKTGAVFMPTIPAQVNRTLHLNSTDDKVNVVRSNDVYYLDNTYYFNNQSVEDFLLDMMVGNYSFIVFDRSVPHMDLILSHKITKGRLTKVIDSKVLMFQNCSMTPIKMSQQHDTVVNACGDIVVTQVDIPSDPGFYYVFENQTDNVKLKFGDGLCEVRNISDPVDLINMFLKGKDCRAVLSQARNITIFNEYITSNGITVFIGDIPVYVVDKNLTVFTKVGISCPDSGDQNAIEVRSTDGAFMGNAYRVRGHGLFTAAHVLLTNNIADGDSVVLCVRGTAYETKRVRLSMAFDIAQLDSSNVPSEPQFEWGPDFSSGRCSVISSVDGVMNYRDNVVVGKLHREPRVVDRLARSGQYTSIPGMSGSPVLCEGKLVGFNAAAAYGVAFVLPFVPISEWGDVAENYQEWYQTGLFDWAWGIRYHSLGDHFDSYTVNFLVMVVMFSIFAFTLWYSQGVQSIYHEIYNDARLSVFAKAAEAGVLLYKRPVTTAFETIVSKIPSVFTSSFTYVALGCAYFIHSYNSMNWHANEKSWLGQATEFGVIAIISCVILPAHYLRDYQINGDIYAFMAVVVVVFICVNIIVGFYSFMKGRSDLVALKGHIKTEMDLAKLQVFDQLSSITPSNKFVNLIYHFAIMICGKFFYTTFRNARWHSSVEVCGVNSSLITCVISYIKLADVFVLSVVGLTVYFVLLCCQFQPFIFTKIEAVEHCKKELSLLFKTQYEKLVFFDGKGAVNHIVEGNNDTRLTLLRKALVQCSDEVKSKIAACKEASKKKIIKDQVKAIQSQKGKKDELVTAVAEVPTANETGASPDGTAVEWAQVDVQLKSLFTTIAETLKSGRWTDVIEENICATAIEVTSGLGNKKHVQAVYDMPYIKPVQNEICQIAPDLLEPDSIYIMVAAIAVFLACFYSTFGRSAFALIIYVILSISVAFILSYTQRIVIMRPLVMGDDDKRDYLVRFLCSNGFLIFGVKFETDHPEIDINKAKSYNGPVNFTTLNRVISYVLIVLAVLVTDEFGVTFHSAAESAAPILSVLWVLPFVGFMVFIMSGYGRDTIKKTYLVIVSRNGDYKKKEIDLEGNIGEAAKTVPDVVPKANKALEKQPVKNSTVKDKPRRLLSVKFVENDSS